MELKEVYRVGGFVRDTLLGQNPVDVDYVVIGESPASMLEKGFEQVGHFPKFIHPQTGEDYALGRSAITGREEGFLYDWRGVTLEQDLYHRDLTVNAMAMTNDGRIIDPHGGQEDLAMGVLRHVGDSSFLEDPLRIFRVARFAGRYDFVVAPETMTLMAAMVEQGMLKDIKAERIWAETEKALLTRLPRRYFEVLDECGALAVTFPELKALQGVVQRADYHAEGDAYVHTLMVLDEAVALTEMQEESRKLRIRAGALLHDLGKAYTPRELLWNPDGSVRGSHHGHESPEVFGKPLRALAERICMPSAVHGFAYKAGISHQRIHALGKPTPNGLEALFTALDLDRVLRHDSHILEDIAAVCEADFFGRLFTKPGGLLAKPEEYPQAAIFIEMMPKIAAVEAGPIFMATSARYKAKSEKSGRALDMSVVLEASKSAVRAARRAAAKAGLQADTQPPEPG